MPSIGCQKHAIDPYSEQIIIDVISLPCDEFKFKFFNVRLNESGNMQKKTRKLAIPAALLIPHIDITTMAS